MSRFLMPSQDGCDPSPADESGRPLCERSLTWDGLSPICGEPAIVLTRAMCVHEHLGEAHVCAGCLAEMRRFCDDDEWDCDECWYGSQPHDCPMPITVTELAVTS